MIRRLKPHHSNRLERLAEVHRAAFAPTSRGWNGDEIADLAAAGILLADDSNRGFALLSLAVDEAELLTIAVHPEHRRQGLARDLLRAANTVLSAENVQKIHLEVAADNAGAIALYQALGYQVSGRRKQYYQRASGDRIDALMMAADLRVE